MKQLNKFLILSFSAIALGGCAFHMGVVDGSTAIADGNFRVVETAYGFSRSTHFLGIGGLGHTGMTHEARQDMLRRFPLAPGEAYANITTDYKRSFFPLVGTTTCYVSADKIRFEAAPALESTDSPPESSTITFQENDKVAAYNIQSRKKRIARVEKMTDTRIFLMYDGLKRGSASRLENTKEIVVFETTPEYYTGTVRIGDKFKVPGGQTIYTVIGLSESAFLVTDQSGSLHRLNYNQTELSKFID